MAPCAQSLSCFLCPSPARGYGTSQEASDQSLHAVQITLCTGLDSSRFSDSGMQCGTYNVASNSWTVSGSVLLPINHLAYCTDGSELRMISGRQGFNAATLPAEGTCQTFDMETRQAQPCADLPYPAGGTGKCINAQGGFWVFGGELNGDQFSVYGDMVGGDANPSANGGVLSAVSFFDRSSGTWTQHAEMSIAKHGILPVKHDGYVYIAGGGVDSGGSGSSSMIRANLALLQQCAV